MTKWLSLVVFIAFGFVFKAHSAIEEIPLESIRLPSYDLYLPGYGQLSPEEAFERQLDPISPLDLSKLNPVPSELWNDRPVQAYSEADDRLELKSGETVRYRGGLTSASGMYRFNAEAENLSSPYIIVMDKTLHTLLLRRNLLRKLGYRIPAIKYLKNLTVEFDSLTEKEKFLKEELPQATLGAPRRWVTAGLEDDSLTIRLQDIAVTQPRESDHYNLAFGVPPKVLDTRTLRSLIIPYALLDIGESLNKVEWTVGKIDNHRIRLPHFTLAQMNATYEDALWMARKLVSLSENDLKEVVEQAHFPQEGAKLLSEKLLSRRNSLRQLFKLDSASKEFAFNPEISQGEFLVKGALTKEEWAGYASRFSHGAPDSPFEDFGYYIFAQTQSIIIDELVNRVNKYLTTFDLNESRFNYMKKEFETGLKHFVETGEFLEQKVGTWFSPTLDGQLILSRDIVIGNYLGTDNMVQLADTFGFSIRVGGHLGIEGLPGGLVGSANGGLSYVKTFTHLKPVKTLKESVKEPYKNMLVPFVKYILRKKTDTLVELLQSNDQANEEERTEIEEVFQKFSDTLSVGESLIITERISPNLSLTAQYNFIPTSVSGTIDTQGLLVKRIHLYRKDAKTLQIYFDNGMSLSLAVTLNLRHYIPVLRIQAKNTKGKYDVKLHQLNLDQNLEDNPELRTSLQGLAHLLKKGSNELLEVSNPPFEVTNNFTEKSNRFAFFHWRSRHLRQNDYFQIKSPQGADNKFFKRTDNNQSGLNYKAFATDIANYYLNQYFSGLSISSSPWVNPGQTTYGVAESEGTRFEARLNGSSFSERFLSLSRKSEGWKISVKKLQEKMTEVNDRYGRSIFPLELALEATSLKLFSLTVDLNLYEEAITRLSRLSNEQLRALGSEYRKRSGFSNACNNGRNLHRNDLRRGRSTLLVDEVRCGNFSTLISKNDSCKSFALKNKMEEWAGCLSEFTKSLEKHLDFDDFLDLVGGERNVYLSGQINGFREESEILSDPIISNTIGERGSRFWNGPVEAVRSMLGLQAGEFNGSWIRESL